MGSLTSASVGGSCLVVARLRSGGAWRLSYRRLRIGSSGWSFRWVLSGFWTLASRSRRICCTSRRAAVWTSPWDPWYPRSPSDTHTTLHQPPEPSISTAAGIADISCHLSDHSVRTSVRHAWRLWARLGCYPWVIPWGGRMGLEPVLWSLHRQWPKFAVSVLYSFYYYTFFEMLCTRCKSNNVKHRMESVVCTECGFMKVTSEVMQKVMLVAEQ